MSRRAYNGAATMSGHVSGVAAQIEVQRTAVYVHCLTHSTNLCLQTVEQECAPVCEALELTMGISQLVLSKKVKLV